MLFNSSSFAVFFLAVFLVSWLLVYRLGWRNFFLGLASLFFYMCWNPTYVLLILLSSAIDFTAGLAIHNRQDAAVRKRWLVYSLAGNLGILFFFKYFGFATSSLETLGHLVGLELHLPALHLLLPVGISFYTFQSMSYTLDIYQRKLEPTRSLVGFLMYVAFFPQLVAGPIVRARDFLPQLDQSPSLSSSEMGEAVFRIMVGLVKKVIISDFLAVNLVDRVYESPDMYSSLEILLGGVYGYSLQIYCDFSGYSDIAIGTARLLGFRLPENFDLPYRARSIGEYWRRWHMSLSTWLRDYLYVPMGGNRGRRPWHVYRNLFLTMLIGGLWHGAAWTFVVWGALHGGVMAAERFVRDRFRSHDDKRPLLPAWLGFLLTFHFIGFVFILFRSGSFAKAGTVFRGLLELSWTTANLQIWLIVALVAGYLGHVLPKSVFERMSALFVGLPVWIQAALLIGLVWLLSVVAGSDVVPFIYFQF